VAKTVGTISLQFVVNLDLRDGKDL
jgi:hypothetical protein